MSERPTAFERLSIAVGSSNLTMDTIHRGDLDFIVALGIASARNGAVASSLMRLHLASTPAALKTAYASVLGLTKRFNSKRNWRLSGRSMQVVALQALAHHIVPVCQHCHGRKFELIEGAPALSAKVCKHCHGTGRRPVQKKHRDCIELVIAALEQIDSVTERAVARLVR
jgi:hypothetical protein